MLGHYITCIYFIYYELFLLKCGTSFWWEFDCDLQNLYQNSVPVLTGTLSICCPVTHLPALCPTLCSQHFHPDQGALWCAQLLLSFTQLSVLAQHTRGEAAAFSFPTFSRGNDILSGLLLWNWILMKCYCCTPLYKEHMWLQVINYSLEEPNKRLSCLKYFMATIHFFSPVIKIAME